MQRAAPPRGAIVVGGYVNGLGLVRALAAGGVPTAVVTTKPYDLAHHSRFARASVRVDGLAEQPEVLVDLLEQRARQWRGTVLFPTNDESLAALSLHRERLRSLGYRPLAPPGDVTGVLLDKALMHDAAARAGLAQPRRYGSAGDGSATVPDAAFPVLVKPAASYRLQARHGTKVLLARDRVELGRCAALLATIGERGHAYERIPGPDGLIVAYCTYLDEGGVPLGGVTIRKLRQSPPGFGVARVAELVPDVPELVEGTVALARLVDLRGFAAAEWKLDPRDGRYRFIELNGRSVVYNALLRKGGLDLAATAWREQADGRAAGVAQTGWPGTWVNLHADVLTSAFLRGRERLSLGDYLAPYRRRTIDAVWSARDPLPFLAQWGRTARQGGLAVGDGSVGELLARREPGLTGRR